MVLLNGAGNRDERRWPDAQQFDIHREIGHHLSFGYGLHFCLGAALARASRGVLALDEVLQRWPDWEVDTDGAVMAHTSTARGLGEAPRRDALTSGVPCGDEFGTGEPSHWYGNRTRDRVHDDRGRPGGGLRVLADPSAHADIDGTGWVRESLDGDRIAAAGQVFRMAMYHENHPDKDYKMANRVEVFDEPRPSPGSPAGVARDRGAHLRRLDLALRPRANRPVADDGDADVRLVSGPTRRARVHPVPAVRAGPHRQLAAAPVRPRRLVEPGA